MSHPEAERDFHSLVDAVRTWVENHMDQWEKFKFEWEHGTVYVTISMQDEHPDNFDLIERR